MAAANMLTHYSASRAMGRRPGAHATRRPATIQRRAGRPDRRENGGGRVALDGEVRGWENVARRGRRPATRRPAGARSSLIVCR